MNDKITSEVLAEVYNERCAQFAKWGKQAHPMSFWMAILMEEVGESAKEIQTGNYKHLKTELIQVAAVAVQICEHIEEIIGGGDEL